jgi:hypothetical protein
MNKSETDSDNGKLPSLERQQYIYMLCARDLRGNNETVTVDFVNLIPGLSSILGGEIRRAQREGSLSK